MTESKHNPLPYRRDIGQLSKETYKGRLQECVISSQGYVAACFDDVDNADFIVRACNSYYKLLNAAKEGLLALRSADAIDLEQRIGFNKAKKALQEAIAAAEVNNHAI